MAQPIFLYWHQGWDEAPGLVKECAQSWIHHHQGSDWKVHLLHRGNIEEWLTKSDPEDFKALQRFECRQQNEKNVGGLAHFADLLRLTLLESHGGVWTDATTLCFAPLDSWLPVPCSMGMPRSLAQSRRTETWFIDNRFRDPALGAWKKRYRDLYFSETSRITYLDNWGIPRYRPAYWMVNLAMRSKTMSMRIWNGRIALSLLKVRPYFATNHILEYVLRHEIPIERIRCLHHLILPIDSELMWEIHMADWSEPMTPYMHKRVQSAPFIKLNHKAKWAERAEKGKLKSNSAWNHWTARAKGLNVE